MPPRRAAPLSDTFDPSAVMEAEKRVRDLGAVPASKVVPKGLSRTGQAAFLEALARAGLERTGTRIRVPADLQLMNRLAQGSAPMKGLARRLAGVTEAELKRSVTRLAADASILVVMRDGKEWLTVPTGSELAPAELESFRAFAKRIAALDKSLGAGKKTPPRTLDRNDVLAAIKLFSGSAVAPSNSSATPAERILEALRRAADPQTGLARVPDAVRPLLSAMSPEEARSALLELDMGGFIELRPESGIGLLSEDDAALCPRGARGVFLSFARLIDRS